MAAETSATALSHEDRSADDDLATRIRLFAGVLNLGAIRHLHIQVRDGNATLTGIVRSFYERQVAIACVQRVAGVRHVHDRVSVREDSLAPFAPHSDWAEVHS